MRGLLASLLGVTLIAVTNWGKVNAVFDDEAYAIDWHSSNIGKYKCVLPASNEAHVDQLLILSAYDSSSTVSYTHLDVYKRQTILLHNCLLYWISMCWRLLLAPGQFLNTLKMI